MLLRVVLLSNANINAQNMQTAKENYVTQAQKCVSTVRRDVPN